jgi:hypothetical protein
VGFLKARPDRLPGDDVAPALAAEGLASLEALADAGNPIAGAVLRAACASGQLFLETSSRVLTKPSTQDVVNGAIDALAGFFAAARPDGVPDLEWQGLVEEAERFVDKDGAAGEVLEQGVISRDQLIALRILSGLNYGVLRPIFKRSDAIGSLMRKQLKPVLEPLLGQIEQLRGPFS